tara:strand:- start:6 stop:212 length:207 start_codon:yes stop_codon:yes gene_type:complete
MQNLSISQDRVHLDVLVTNVFHDVKYFDANVELKHIYSAIESLHHEQDLFIFSNGTVSGTKKGLNKYE